MAARALKIDYLQQANLESLVWWIHDKTRRNLPINIDEWDAVYLNNLTELKDIEKKQLKRNSLGLKEGLTIMIGTKWQQMHLQRNLVPQKFHSVM